MRSLRFVPLVALLVSPAYAEERTWTISTGSYAIAAELVEVRGDIAYLKTGDKVEHIPLARLSAGDMRYIESLTPTAVYPGPADDAAPPAELPLPQNEADAAPIVGPTLNSAAPPTTTTSRKPIIKAPVPSPNTVRANQYPPADESLPTPPSINRQRSQAARVAPRPQNNPNARRPASAPRQNQNASANRNRSQNDERPGLFGRRARRGN